MAKSSSNAQFSPDDRIAVIAGKEHFLREEFTRNLREALERGHGEVEIFRFDGETCDLAAVLDELRSYGLIQSYKLVILDQAEEFLAKEDGAYRKPMERYAENPVDHATLLMRAETWRKSNLDKLIQKHGAIVKCEEMKEPDAVAWCVRRAKDEYGVTLDRAAANVLVQRIGAGLTRLDSEIGKLASMTKEGETISRDHVVEMVGMSREEKAWEIQEAILSGKPGYALRRLHELRHVSNVPSELMVWSFSDLCRKLHLASRLLAQGLPPGMAAKEARLWGDGRDAMLESARRVGPPRLASFLHRCLELDAQRKTGLASEWRSLECLAAEMADTLGSG